MKDIENLRILSLKASKNFPTVLYIVHLKAILFASSNAAKGSTSFNILFILGCVSMWEKLHTITNFLTNLPSRCFSGKESACQWRRHGFDSWVVIFPWRRVWQPAPVFLPGESYGQRSLAGSMGLQKSGHDWAIQTWMRKNLQYLTNTMVHNGHSIMEAAHKDNGV